jgi:hypothetical protein
VITLKQIEEIVAKVSYKNWIFTISSKGDGFLLQASFTAPDSKTGQVCIQRCRKWYISSHACEGEIVRTVYKAVEAAELHELQENFKFCGQSIFGPHLAPEDLALLIAGGWVGESIRAPMPASKKFSEGAKKSLGKRPTRKRVQHGQANSR